MALTTVQAVSKQLKPLAKGGKGREADQPLFPLTTARSLLSAQPTLSLTYPTHPNPTQSICKEEDAAATTAEDVRSR